MTSHTKAFHDLVFDTVNSLHLQLNLRMSEIHTCQLQQGHIPISSAQCMVVGCISYCPNPFWLSLAQRRARAISVPCSLTPSLAQPSHNPVSVPFFRSCLWLCVGSCSLVGTWSRESQSTHTHQTKQSSHAPLSMAVGSDIAKRFAKTPAPSHPLYRLQGGLYLLTPSASSCSSHS